MRLPLVDAEAEIRIKYFPKESEAVGVLKFFILKRILLINIGSISIQASLTNVG
ncbi:MAG: hypothetical protein QXQ57_01620 [Sulfolobales archaeon]